MPPQASEFLYGRDLLTACRIDPARLHRFEKLVFSSLVLLVQALILWSLLDVMTSFGVDLRNRVVGARVLLAGEDPYRFVWQPGMPESLLDPTYDEQFPIHRLSAPPTVLGMYALVSWLPYRTIRLLSWGLEWLAVIGSIYCLAQALRDDRLRFYFLLFAACFFLLGAFWRAHLAHGQLYVFFLFLLALAYRWACRDGLDSLRVGVVLGLLVAVRPNFALLIPAVLVLRCWRLALSTCATAAGVVVVSLLLCPASYWTSYLDMGNQHYLCTWNREEIEVLPMPPRPEVLEGYRLEEHKSLKHATVSLPSIYLLVRGQHTQLAQLDVGLLSKIALACLAAVLVVLLLLRKHSTRLTFGLITLFLVVSEYFLPVRWTYTDIMFLAPLGMLLPLLRISLRRQPLPALAVLTGLLLGSLLVVGVDFWLASMLRSLLVMGGLSVLVLHAWWQPGLTAQQT